MASKELLVILSQKSEESFRGIEYETSAWQEEKSRNQLAFFLLR